MVHEVLCLCWSEGQCSWFAAHGWTEWGRPYTPTRTSERLASIIPDVVAPPLTLCSKLTPESRLSQKRLSAPRTFFVASPSSPGSPSEMRVMTS